jgi:hypothetical protein
MNKWSAKKRAFRRVAISFLLSFEEGIRNRQDWSDERVWKVIIYSDPN